MHACWALMKRHIPSMCAESTQNAAPQYANPKSDVRLVALKCKEG